MGEKKRHVSFNLEHEEERRLYELSKTLNFAQLVKRALHKELSKSQVGPSSIIVRMED